MRQKLNLSLLVVLVMAGIPAVASDYVIGSGDVLAIRFWQEPDLNSELTVGEDGTIALDVIGEIVAAGKTTLQVQDDIVRQISRLKKSISQAVVRVTQYNYQHVFVLGQVSNPGKFAFEKIPDIVTILSEAGWITPQGDLSRVTLIRGGERSGQVEVVDLATAVADGGVASMPLVYRQDALEVPQTPAGIPQADIGTKAGMKSVVYVTGAVNTPGGITWEKDLDLYDAIARAGGPTENASMDKVKVIHKDGPYGQATHVDLVQYAETGRPTRYIMSREDHVVIPVRRGGFMGGTIGTFATVLGVVTSAVLLYETLKPQDEAGQN